MILLPPTNRMHTIRLVGVGLLLSLSFSFFPAVFFLFLSHSLHTLPSGWLAGLELELGFFSLPSVLS